MKELTQEILHKWLDYEPETGNFRWKIHTKPEKLNKIAGAVNSKGYVWIYFYPTQTSYQAHRLVWFYVYGIWPTHGLDHINRCKTDNRLVNLRDVPLNINHQNRDILDSNTSGYTGVFVTNRKNPYRARIRINGKRVSLGSFATAEEAQLAYETAKKKLLMEHLG